MTGTILLMIAAAAGFVFWSASRAAAERATRLGQDACRAAGVQLIDHSVHADGLRLRRHEDGRLGLAYSFRFYYSDDGVQRHIGHLVLHGERLVSFSGPVPAAGADPAAPRH